MKAIEKLLLALKYPLVTITTVLVCVAAIETLPPLGRLCLNVIAVASGCALTLYFRFSSDQEYRVDYNPAINFIISVIGFVFGAFNILLGFFLILGVLGLLGGDLIGP